MRPWSYVRSNFANGPCCLRPCFAVCQSTCSQDIAPCSGSAFVLQPLRSQTSRLRESVKPSLHASLCSASSSMFANSCQNASQPISSQHLAIRAQMPHVLKRIGIVRGKPSSDSSARPRSYAPSPMLGVRSIIAKPIFLYLSVSSLHV